MKDFLADKDFSEILFGILEESSLREKLIEKIYSRLNNKFQNGELTFKKLIDGYTHFAKLNKLLDNERFFKTALNKKKLTNDDLRYLIIKTSECNYKYYFNNFFSNKPLLDHILNNFVLDKKTVDAMNDSFKNDWGDVFDLLERRETDGFYGKRSDDLIDKERLKLIELNRKVYLLNSFDLTKDQKLELIELVQNNEIARNRLKDIIDNQLESNYDFESLMVYLKKIEKKNVLNI